MSESNKFTPGPWVVSKDDSEIEKFVVAARGTVCEVFESFAADLVWGNAFLISAAPDLLEALELVEQCGFDDEDESGWGVIRITKEDWIEIKCAISKARGQQ